MIPILLAQPESNAALIHGHYAQPQAMPLQNLWQTKSTRTKKPSALFYQRMVQASHYTMIIAGLVLLASIAVSYFYSDILLLSTQLMGHIMIIVASTAIKFGYIARCIGRHGLGKKQL